MAVVRWGSNADDRLTAAIVGYDPGCMNGVLGSNDFKQRYGVSDDGGETMYLTPTTKSLFSSLAVIGALIGCFIPAAVTNKIGRKGCFMMASVSHMIGVCILLAAPPAAVFILGRIFIGVALGLITAISGAYLNEASSPGLRGSIFSILQQMLTVGTVLSNGINWATKSLPGANSWRVSVGFQFLISIVMLSASLVAPESPSVLVRWGRSEDAANSLAITQGLDSFSDEVQTIVRRLEKDSPSTSAIITKEDMLHPTPPAPTFWTLFRECFQGTALRRTLLVAAVSALCLSTGFVFWTSYGTTFLADAGVSDAYMVSFILAAVQFACTIPTIWLTDLLGRRTLLLIGTSIMGLVLFLAGLLYTVLPRGHPTATQMLIAGAVTYIGSYGATWGPVTWLVMAEPLSARHRIPQTTVTFAVYWLTYLVIGFATPFLVDRSAVNMGPYICYLWFGGVVVALLWVYACVPELTGLSEGQIDMLFEQRVPAWRSKAWKREMIAAEEAVVAAERGVVVVVSGGMGHNSAETLVVAGGDCGKGMKAVDAGEKDDKKQTMVQHEVREVDSSSDSDRE
ncbi:general substrate transporter [Microdochium bolleyi]|uniref:General substrate transporter n=1 Tax=Microdochium bolleyi TaxID=196109 RepID=A0A136J100_9PEZI|nr:general substrate transporter [Microdochium bolleyi]